MLKKFAFVFNIFPSKDTFGVCRIYIDKGNWKHLKNISYEFPNKNITNGFSMEQFSRRTPVKGFKFILFCLFYTLSKNIYNFICTDSDSLNFLNLCNRARILFIIKFWGSAAEEYSV